MIRQTSTAWGLGTKLIHWTTAMLIIANIVGGVYLGRIFVFSNPDHHDRWLLFMNLHKTIGVLVLVFMPLRAVWTFSQPRPELPAGMTLPHSIAARISVISLYLAMICVPLMGLLLSLFARAEFKLFGVFDLDSPFMRNKPLMETFRTLHQITAYCLLALVFIHICAALTHHFILRDDVLARMAFRRKTAE